MNSIRQLLRQPIRTLTGIAMTAAAVAVLCVCLGQYLTAGGMEQSLEEIYTTGALLTAKSQIVSLNQYGESVLAQRIPDEVNEWLDGFIKEHSDMVLADLRPGLSSAFIPELTIDNYTRYKSATGKNDNRQFETSPQGTPYTGAVLAVTLLEISEPTWVYYGRLSDGEERWKAVVDEVICLEEGYHNPVGYTIYLTMSQEEATDLKAGDRCIVYGLNYFDWDWQLRSDDASYKEDNIFCEKIERDGLVYFTEEEIERWGTFNIGYYLYYEEDHETGKRTYYTLNIDEVSKDMVLTVSLTVHDGGIRTLSGSVGDFLASTEGEWWQRRIAEIRICNQSFPVIGVEDLSAVGEFLMGDTVISEGRDFTEKEIVSGENVCVISGYLAGLNGLGVGDILHLQYYTTDYTTEAGQLQQRIADGYGVVKPGAYFYLEGSELMEEKEYVIVGLYEQDVLWGDPEVNRYTFTPNTIFVPGSSVAVEMEYADQAFFRTLLLQNGMAEEFLDLVNKEGYEGLFVCGDQGYTTVYDSLHDYREVAGQALLTGVSISAVLVLLFFLLFPALQKKVLWTMGSLGAEKKEKQAHIMIHLLGMLVPGTIGGFLAGVLLWQSVAQQMMASAEVVLELTLNVWLLAAIAVLLFCAESLLACLVSSVMVREKQSAEKKKRSDASGCRKKTVRRHWSAVWGPFVYAFIVCAILCLLKASEEKELADYEKTYQTQPVKVTVMQNTGSGAENMSVTGYIYDMFANPSYASFNLSDYLTDVCVNSHYKVDWVNGGSSDFYPGNLTGITDTGAAAELTQEYNGEIIWKEGYDESVFSLDEFLCLVPESYTEDADKETDGQQIRMRFSYNEKIDEFTSIFHENEETFTVAGTYITDAGVNTVYCSYVTLERICARVHTEALIDSLSATIKDNSQLEAFRTSASSYFLMDNGTVSYKDYMLDIDDDTLKTIAAALENSITVNHACAMIVFFLSAGAGFLLGFLLVRNRKREILLMRALGKPNQDIYRDFALEQMAYVVTGGVTGAAYFCWHPLSRLFLFVLIYFAGLSVALLLFLRIQLMTAMKEE